MPKSTKSKSTKAPTKSAKTVTPKPEQTTASGSESSVETKKSRPAAKPYKSSNPPGLTHKQKAALAHHIMERAGDLMEMDDAKLGSEDLVGIDRELMGNQLSAWVSYLPGSYWDRRLPQPARARGRRKL